MKSQGLAAGAPLVDCAKLANYAGTITVCKKSLAVATPEELYKTYGLTSENIAAAAKKAIEEKK